MKKSSSELKLISRNNLAGNWGCSILASLAVVSILPITTLIITVLGDIIAAIAPIIGAIIGICYIIIIVIIVIILRLGTCKFYLNLNRHLALSISDIFSGFSGGAGRFIIANLLKGLISFLCFLPAEFFIFQSLTPSMSVNDISIILILIGSLFYVSGIILFLYFAFGFSMTQFILIDDCSKTAIDGMKESWRLMKGNKGRYFYINISFSGWAFLAAIPCGLGYLLLIPYINCVCAIFI